MKNFQLTYLMFFHILIHSLTIFVYSPFESFIVKPTLTDLLTERCVCEDID